MNVKGIEVMQLQVANYYLHEDSNTMWHILETGVSPMPYFIAELKNEYGDVKQINTITDVNGVYAREGSFKLITKKDWEERK